ncbi:hypothetical protein, partial [Flavobacterium filum]|uniref:hypothetical protein n=1 Tax=Flavobacterium filum TaxID=370974 RepID=UPI0023F131C6
LNKFVNNFNEFLEDYHSSNSEFIFKPFFSTFEFKKYWKKINMLTNTQLIELGFLIEYRYRPAISPELLSEKEFLINLKQKLEGKITAKKSSKIDIATYKNVIEKINKVLPNF